MSQTDGVQSQWVYLEPRGLSSAELMMWTYGVFTYEM
jgi:hypothetical protein